MEFVIYLVLAGVIFGFIYRVARYQTHVPKDATFHAYVARHPNLVASGRVTCFACGSNSIWMKGGRRTFLGIRYAHTCRTCGTELYFSS